MDTHYYPVDLTWTGGRKGLLSSTDVQQSFEVATPPQFPNGVEGIWSPEHLLTAAVSSCLMTTFLSIAEKSRLPFTAFSCKAKGKLEQVEGRFLMTEVLLDAYLRLDKAEDREKAEMVLQRSEELCLISNSIKAKITLTPHVSI
jgi:organic hydroperoxide reductase OsmC/OhrA